MKWFNLKEGMGMVWAGRGTDNCVLYVEYFYNLLKLELYQIFLLSCYFIVVIKFHNIMKFTILTIFKCIIL